MDARSWQCQICLAFYVTLFELVSHVRAAHSTANSLNLVCGINRCSSVFVNTNSWYKHILDKHYSDYHVEPSTICGNDDHELSNNTYTSQSLDLEETPPASALELDVEQDNVEDITCTFPLMSNEHIFHNVSTFVAQNMAAGQLVKLRERHHLSQAGVNEVVQIINSVSDHIILEVLAKVWQSGEAHGMDTTSAFFQDLPNILDSVRNPFALLSTAYRQHSYVIKNFPYVVS